MKLLILGGAGNMATAAVEKLVMDDVFDEIIIADYDLAKAEQKVKELANSKFSARKIDVLDKQALVQEMNQVDVVANCTGPYYRLLEPVIDALFESDCKNYIDFCDDIEIMKEVQTQARERLAKTRGMHVILGLGGSPGLIPVEIMYAASLMDQTDDVYLNMLMDELEEAGTAVWDHYFENFNGEIDIWKDGKLQKEDGLAQAYTYDFDPKVFENVGNMKVYTLGHPEVYTLPRALPELKNIEIRVGFYPQEATQIVADLNRLGFLRTDAIEVDGQKVSPRSVLLALMNETVLDPQFPGGFTPTTREPADYITGTAIEVHGTKDGKAVRYYSSFMSDMGSLTGYPLAVGAKLLAQGKIERTGIMIPEEAIADPKAFVEDVFDSIAEQGKPVKRAAEVRQEL